jgi:hypothetical protein
VAGERQEGGRFRIYEEMDPEVFFPLASALEREGVEYVLVGGVALGLQGLTRATKDIDLFIRPVEDNVVRLRRALREVFQDDSVEEIMAEDLAGDYSVVRYGPPEVDYLIDIIGHIGEAFSYEDLEADVMNVQGIRIPVATPRTLYRMKWESLRPRDQMDAQVLRERYGFEEP